MGVGSTAGSWAHRPHCLVLGKASSHRLQPDRSSICRPARTCPCGPSNKHEPSCTPDVLQGLTALPSANRPSILRETSSAMTGSPSEMPGPEPWTLPPFACPELPQLWAWTLQHSWDEQDWGGSLGLIVRTGQLDRPRRGTPGLVHLAEALPCAELRVCVWEHSKPDTWLLCS